jgi:hypothetical protein
MNMVSNFYECSIKLKEMYTKPVLRSRSWSRKELHHFGGAGAVTRCGSGSGSGSGSDGSNRDVYNNLHFTESEEKRKENFLLEPELHKNNAAPQHCTKHWVLQPCKKHN